MTDPAPTSAVKANSGTVAATAAPARAETLKKGSLVRLNRSAYLGSLEASASPSELPAYVLEGPGEILAVQGPHAQIRWRRPVPDVWLRLDQLEGWKA
ncbi:MAG: NAD(P)H-quinone oxidoreductase subunit O [Cyanobacteriota bacterium]|nr:NAD(P)H-quinone oxidoreductase subunit O [Cyanobacteriota bacterium]